MTANPSGPGRANDSGPALGNGSIVNRSGARSGEIQRPSGDARATRGANIAPPL